MSGGRRAWLVVNLAAWLVTAAWCEPSTYVVQMSREEMPASGTALEWFAATVQSAAAAEATEMSLEGGAERIIYTYESAFHGFAAKLSEDEALRLERRPGVVAVFPETVYQLHTTRSPGFLGLQSEAFVGFRSSAVASYDVIVGVLDTGIWPESASFSDAGMGPVPARWKGACETGRGFPAKSCNRKIIGARAFSRGYEAFTGGPDGGDLSPRDHDGHGTHTAATAAGSAVANASLQGYAVAAYKVCWPGGCFSSDILSAVDRAVADGVDVLSISLGGGVSAYYKDSLSVAAFGAMEKGVFVACSAGNSGPEPVTLANVSPWITTVGASTMDRDFPAAVVLGTRRKLAGASLYKGVRHLSPEKQYPLVYFGGNASSPDPASLCLEGTLDTKLAVGKIVLCDRGITPRVQKGQVVKQAAAPPGPSSLAADRRRVAFNILSGTSMSCPHVAGVAALLKASHPDWSPAAIKSALMTTAYVQDNTRRPLRDAAAGAAGRASTAYDHGAGHIDPARALDPGLVYDIGRQDYVNFLCSQKLTPLELRVFTRSSKESCRRALASPGDLNYPAISAVLPAHSPAAKLTLHRTVTNVGAAASTYRAVVSSFNGATVVVEPTTLRFTRKYQKLQYTVTFTRRARRSSPEFGALVWKDAAHSVRSPVVVTYLSPI
ncbi:unnamed protein product [Spirodela intermedia]|uniref:Uncharacterized protein n=1 Tax=Spirodela intermedia TaxID=51605 RepID=A0A7I8JU45_SPIIN|nr:unnamed protein product [Spirodela intermedia]CAA6673599.1 unnamed protein product [Spirodela intermedia]